MTEDNPEYQIGAHDVDAENIDFGENSEFIEFELEAKTVFKRLAEDIYESPAAGIREPLTNSTTAVLRAQEEYDLGTNEGVIEFTLKYEGGGLILVIRDNGIGISDGELREILSVIGRSANRDDPSMAGKFGMGFLSLWMLVGMKGGFEMYTHSRKPGAEPLSGVWKSGGFARDGDGVLDEGFGEDEYGTEFRLPLKEELSSNDVRNWIDTFAQWCRVPVLYREYNSDGREVFNEDYGGQSILESLDEDQPAITLDNQYFAAVNSRNGLNETILLDVPVERNTSSRLSLPFNSFAIQLKKENSVVVSGPNEGQFPIPENEYREMDSSRQAKYIPKTRLRAEDVVMPGPTGTRDKLGQGDEFWEYIEKQVWEKYYTRCRQLFQDVSSVSDVFAKPEEETQFIIHATDTLSKTSTSLDTVIQNKLGIRLSQHLVDGFEVFHDRIEFARRGDDDVSKQENRRRVLLHEVLEASHDDDGNSGDVFMGVSLNDLKAKVAWADGELNQIVRVESTEEYAKFENRFGWKKLKEIKRDTIDQYNIPKALKERFVGTEHKNTVNARKDPGEKELTVHFGSRNRNTVKRKAHRLYEAAKNLEEGDPASFGFKQFTAIVLFPSNCEENLSDYYWMADKDNVGIASCSVSVYEYLSERERIYRFEDYAEQAQTMELETSNGVLTYSEVEERGTPVFHILPEETVDLFRENRAMMNNIREYFEKFVCIGGYRRPEIDDAVYIPVTQNVFDMLRPVARSSRVISSEAGHVGNVGKRASIECDTPVYAYARLPEWHDTSELDVILESDVFLTDGGLDLIETMGLLHDEGRRPNSQTKEN